MTDDDTPANVIAFPSEPTERTRSVYDQLTPEHQADIDACEMILSATNGLGPHAPPLVYGILLWFSQMTPEGQAELLKALRPKNRV